MLGGEREENRRELKIEWYNPEEGKWIHKTTIPTPPRYDYMQEREVLNGCILKLSKGVLDKLRVEKN